VSVRNQSNDNLFEHIRVQNLPHHGISMQDLSAGNVFSECLLENGTLDCHRGMPFDNVRTAIAVRANGSGGGALGPLVGRRTVNWNVTFLGKNTEKSRKRQALIAAPSMYVMGALVGLQGFATQWDPAVAWSLPPGDKGTLVVGAYAKPTPENLYRAQRAFYMRADPPNP
jgi:hypothetical protein